MKIDPAYVENNELRVGDTIILREVQKLRPMDTDGDIPLPKTVSIHVMITQLNPLEGVPTKRTTVTSDYGGNVMSIVDEPIKDGEELLI